MDQTLNRQMQEAASQIDISQTTPVICESCDGNTFKQTLLLRKVSSLVSSTGQEMTVSVAVFACEKCGHVNSDLVDSKLTT